MNRFPVEPSIHERFEVFAARTPSAVALRYEGNSLSYDQLNRRANQVAHRLRSLGVGPDVLVALSAERTPEMVVGILGILKAGGAYVPLDPAYPKDRLAFMLEDSGAEILVTTQNPAVLDLTTVPRPVRQIWTGDVSGEADSDLPSLTKPGDLAYVIYTSGSTGKPKGVLITHGNVVRLMEATAGWFHFGPSDRWTLFHSNAFDFSVWELWGPLLYGGSLVVVPYWVSRSPEAFLNLILEERVTVLNQTPSAFKGLIQADAERKDSRPQFLRTVVFGGEALELQGLRPWFEKHGDRQPQLVNMYGITETTVHVTYRPVGLDDLAAGSGSVIGVPIPDLGLELLDDQLKPVAPGEVGEICVSGAGLARGYLNRPDLTAARFVEVPGAEGAPVRLYRSGDLARRLPDGDLEYLGRSDHQVKIRGFRIELGEIESVIAQNPAVQAVVVLARDDPRGDKRLVAYVVSPGDQAPLTEALRASLRARVPEYMVPSAFVFLAKLPLTENGKVDRKALPEPDGTRPPLVTEFVPPQGPTEESLAAIWRQVLRLDRVGVNDSFFDLGGSSLLAVETLAQLDRHTGRRLPVVALFQHPSVRSLARYLDVGPSTDPGLEAVLARASRSTGSLDLGSAGAVAVIGMAGRFPGSSDIGEFWDNLCAGREGITFFEEDELDPRVDASDPGYVKARGILPGADRFDAKFFGETPKGAALIDPQQRVLLEEVWAALEDAGVVPDRYPGLIGVYAGTGHNTYLLKNVSQRSDLMDEAGDLSVILGNDKDFVASRIAHKLDLHGPALSIHTACSTSLVAVCEAVEHLRRRACDIAVAGGASVTIPQFAGHLYNEGAMLSTDGHTRSFDADASGTVFSDGAGVVVLKRLDEALRDRDRIYAVVRGVGLNNDGGHKASFSAPSISGQAAAIALSHADADINPETLSYVEAHGTATPLGDPVEVEALTQAFRAKTGSKGFCALGSVKSNIGHLTAASGAAGLIKTSLAFHHGKLPGTLHYHRPNPNIDFSQTPFHVLDKLTDWPRTDGTPRRAGVSSFGVGGTNAHVVLEEAPVRAGKGEPKPRRLLLLSAKTDTALQAATDRLGTYLAANPEADLDDVAYTLQVRRTAFSHRRFVVVSDTADAAAALAALPPERAGTKTVPGKAVQTAFVFPGQGTQYVNMGRNLYDRDPLYRRTFDQCAEILRPILGRDLREIVFAAPEDTEAAQASMMNTRITQPAIFTIEYCLAALWRSWGIEPVAFLGHSVGEFVAACLAGVFTLEDALGLVAQRGRLMGELPPGAMLSVRAPAELVEPRLAGSLGLAADNAPNLCVVSGPQAEIEAFQAVLTAEGTVCRLLQTSHAFHSSMMDPVVEPFAELVRKAGPRAPKVPFVSTVSGTWITETEALDPLYWARHLRAPVRFLPGLKTLLSNPDLVLLEVGPRGTSSVMARQVINDAQQQAAVASLGDSAENDAEWTALLRAVGQLWAAGVNPDWEAFHVGGFRNVVSLPAYPFERQRYWVDPPAVGTRSGAPLPVQVQVGSAVSPGMGVENLIARQMEILNAQMKVLRGE